MTRDRYHPTLRWTAALKARVLPGEGGTPLPNLGAAVKAKELELVRDTTWMMTRRQTLRKYQL